MKILATLLTLWSMTTMAAMPPSTILNEQSATGTGSTVTVVPNYQGSSLGGIRTRVETGNTNLLKDPSFEKSSLDSAWVVTNATATANTSVQVEGKKALSLALTGALNFVQDSTINAANLVGLQGVASIKVKTSNVDGLKACIRNAGVTSTTLCLSIPSDGTWKHISIPFIMTATSNGVALTSTGTTGTVYVDDAFVGTSAPFQDVSGARLVGSIVISGCAAGWTTTSTSFVDFSATTGCTYTLTGSAAAPSTMIPAIKFSSLPAGDYRVEYEGLFGSAGSSNSAAFQFWDGVNTARETSWSNGTSNGTTMSPGISQSITYSTAQSNVTFSLRAKVGGASTTAYTYGQTTLPATIKVWYFPPASKIYSQASQDYDWTSFTPVSPNSSFTIGASSCFKKRKGSDLYLRCNFTHSAVSASEARISLPDSLTISSSMPSITISACGKVSRSGFDSSTYHSSLLCTGGQTYLRFGTRNATSTDLTAKAANAAFVAGETMYFESGPIPISSWTDYGVIVGSFGGVPQVPGLTTGVDTFSVSYGTTNASTVCSASPCFIDQIGTIVSSITRSGTGTYVLNLNKTYSKLKCSQVVLGTAVYALSQPIQCSSCNSANFVSANTSSAALDTFGTIICQGTY